MDRKITSRGFMSMTITLFMFVIGNYPNVYATVNSSLSIDSPKNITLPLPLPLPFNSYFANAFNNNQVYTNNLIPFP
jgi:hypothetical protein